MAFLKSSPSNPLTSRLIRIATVCCLLLTAGQAGAAKRPATDAIASYKNNPVASFGLSATFSAGFLGNAITVQDLCISF